MRKVIILSFLSRLLFASAWNPPTPAILVGHRHHSFCTTSNTQAQITTGNFIATNDIRIDYPYQNGSHRCAPLHLYRKVVEDLDSFGNTKSIMSVGTGFIGIGIMGEGMAARLLTQKIAGASENPLIIWNRTASKCTAFADKYKKEGYEVVVKDTAKEVVEACGVTYCMLSTPEASKAVFEADDGVLAGVSEGKCIVDCATLAEADMKRMSEAVTGKGGRFLEAPVSGSKAPAANGLLIFLCAGSKPLFEEIVDNGLNKMGKASHFFSEEVGYGTRAKLVVNSLMGTMIAAFGEGLALAENVGLDPSKMIEVIGQGAIASPVYALKGPKMIVNDHAPNFPLKHAHKDMKLASDMAREAGVEFSVMEKAEELFAKARGDTDLNVADEDFSAIFEAVHKESQGEFSKKRKRA